MASIYRGATGLLPECEILLVVSSFPLAFTCLWHKAFSYQPLSRQSTESTTSRHLASLAVAILSLLSFSVSLAQNPNAALPSGFTEFEQEVKQRTDINYTGFVHNIGPSQVSLVLVSP